jgi:hypothetical protein
MTNDSSTGCTFHDPRPGPSGAPSAAQPRFWAGAISPTWAERITSR